MRFICDKSDSTTQRELFALSFETAMNNNSYEQ